eukprot:c9234_g1_i6.p1 GENE.c9234_g1_i6~~c9234_g1_i6.p1  ORF type:complete len:283 (-),score=51.70 c9234_g1_i6:121-969(-)
MATEAAAGATTEERTDIECYICRELMIVPKVCPECQECICSECLDTWFLRGKTTCPWCRAETTLPEWKVDMKLERYLKNEVSEWKLDNFRKRVPENMTRRERIIFRFLATHPDETASVATKSVSGFAEAAAVSVSGHAGVAVGAVAGGQLGASLGVTFGPVGAVVGCFFGVICGSFGGDHVGRRVAQDWARKRMIADAFKVFNLKKTASWEAVREIFTRRAMVELTSSESAANYLKLYTAYVTLENHFKEQVAQSNADDLRYVTVEKPNPNSTQLRFSVPTA